MANDISALILEQFHHLLQSRQISIYGEGKLGGQPMTHRELSAILHALIDAVGQEIDIAISEAKTNGD